MFSQGLPECNCYGLKVPFSGSLYKVLCSNENGKILLYLKGINSNTIKYVMDFLYNGEINIAEAELYEFLDVANGIQLKGLENKNLDQIELQKGGPKQQREKEDTKEEKCTTSDLVIADDRIDNSEYYYPADLIQTDDDYEIQVQNMIERYQGRSWKCKTCGKICRDKTFAREHAETHIDGIVHICKFCNTVFPKRFSLRHHVNRCHKNKSTVKYAS